MNDWGNIAVGVRSASGGDALFLRSWTAFLAQGGTRKGDAILDPVVELPHHYAANRLGDLFLQTKCDSLLLIDDDMIFDVDCLGRMRQNRATWPFDVCQALYIQRKPPHYPLLIEKDATSPTGHRINPRPPRNTVSEAGVVGFGFTLIRRTVLETIMRTRPADRTVFYWGLNGDSEDACFCFDAQAKGFRLCVDTSVNVGHRNGFVMKWNTEKQGLEILTRSIQRKA